MNSILWKILVIDDDKLIRWSLTEIFSQEGYLVNAVATVKEAIEKIENVNYDLIFADLEINQESSIDILNKVKKSHPLSKIIILSALSKNEIEPLLGSLNIFSIIEKPFQAEQIKAIVQDALG